MDLNFPKKEERILKFWKKNKIFEKSVLRRKKAPNFVFFEGPPTANAKPGIHHVLSRVFKDIICRYKTMKGFKVERKAGWDTHGLPVELEIEKKLGLKSKKDIEKLGIAKFNKLCKESVWNYKKDWEKLTERIAFWLDMENPYITYESDYIESVWWIIKQIYQKGLIYKGYKVLPYCPRCGTSLSSHEVAQGYKKVKENSVYVKFPVKGEKDTYFLIWTTTPWTLPGNVAVAINPNFSYVKVKAGKEYLILAKERMEACGLNGEITEELKGKDLLNLEYEPLFPVRTDLVDKKAYFVIPGDFVSLREGTGLVHIAPAFGEEDMEAIKVQNSSLKSQNLPEFPVLMTVDKEGKMKTPGAKWHNLFVKDADSLIIEDLKGRGLLFKEELYEHDYPFCWRCHSPLLYYAKESWFINMQKVKKNLLQNNQKINWTPLHLKEGRFGEWLKDIKDWAFSRERYWGTPLPAWQCKKCGNLEVVGSLEYLRAQRFSNNNFYFVRHGHSLRQVKNIAVCWPEKIRCPLTKKGEKQVKISAEELRGRKIDLIFSSDLLRAKQTAQIISEETGAKIIFDKRLREYNVGIFNNKDPQLVWDYLENKKNKISAKLPQGESIAQIQQRTYNFLNELNKKYQGKNIIVVSHELPLSVLEGTLKGWQLSKILEWRRGLKGGGIQTGQWRKVEFKDFPHNEKLEPDLHRPYIDEVKFYCPKCSNLMERTPEVMDCWLDSGSMPFAQYHYPFESRELIDKRKQFPADYISEAIDQTRGWFYTLLAISTLLDFGPSYKNVISLGHVLDEKGEKMSKSKGNVVDPWYIINKYGVDATRWYFYTANQPGDPKLFSEKDIEGTLRKFILTLWNSFLFFETYRKKPETRNQKSENILDRWVISKLNGLIKIVTENLDKYDVTGAARAIESFIVADLSQWHIRRSRRRFQKPETDEELKEALATLNFVFLTLSKLVAPFIPFLSEEIHQGLGNKSSVHLGNWPKADQKSINSSLEKEMEQVRGVVALALAERAKAGIKVRQPLSKLKVKSEKFKIDAELLVLIREEVNVKEVSFDSKIKNAVELDTKITPELKEEGIIREIIRNIQELRKKAGLKPENKILVVYSSGPELNKVLERNKKFLLIEAKVKDLICEDKFKKSLDGGRRGLRPCLNLRPAEQDLIKKEVMVGKEKLLLTIKRIK